MAGQSYTRDAIARADMPEAVCAQVLRMMTERRMPRAWVDSGAPHRVAYGEHGRTVVVDAGGRVHGSAREAIAAGAADVYDGGYVVRAGCWYIVAVLGYNTLRVVRVIDSTPSGAPSLSA